MGGWWLENPEAQGYKPLATFETFVMPFALTDRVAIKSGLQRMLRPRTKLGKTTLWFGGLALILELLRFATRSSAGMLAGWANFLVIVAVSCALAMGLRWLRRRLMWRLRNRLIITYIFIGVIPVMLLVAMGCVAGYLFAGQFATYVALSELQSRLQHLESANEVLARQFSSLARSGRLNEQLASEIAGASGASFQHRTVTVWDGGKSFSLPVEHAKEHPAIRPSPGIEGDYHGFVLDRGTLHLRAIKQLDEAGRRLIVISNVPITAGLLQRAASQLGRVTLLPPDSETGRPMPPTPKSGITTERQGDIQVDFGDKGSSINVSGNEANRIGAGELPPPSNSFDMRIPFGTRLVLTDWETGKPMSGLLLVESRLSMLYSALFAALGEKSRIFLDVLTGIAIFFAVIELIALIIGMRLTRSVTKSVAELYRATEHVNRGDLGHRIRIRSQDQMAALEGSFNSMTESLSRLIAEQKEKQRLEGELAIAHEVQALLFPADLSGLSAFEVHGVCRPARTVSGDYYDFIPLRQDRLMLALGDISGKGISAALLMATVHAFVRAYSLEPEQTLASVALGAGGESGGALAVAEWHNGSDGAMAPALLMATLNYQLYRSTPPEKYATMFLGCYDAASRKLTYSNAGHLSPLVLCDDGAISRLEASGTVVGLFDGVAYGQDSIVMKPGDMFVAYSDGITEPENEFGEFGEARLIELIQSNRSQPLARISDIVTTAVSDWIAGAEQPDDVTLVLARAR